MQIAWNPRLQSCGTNNEGKYSCGTISASCGTIGQSDKLWHQQSHVMASPVQIDSQTSHCINNLYCLSQTNYSNKLLI